MSTELWQALRATLRSRARKTPLERIAARIEAIEEKIDRVARWGDHLTADLRRLATLADAPRICTVMLIATDHEHQPMYAAQSFRLPLDHDRLVVIRPQMALAAGGWLIGLGGVLLSSVRVGNTACDACASDSPIARVTVPVAIGAEIRCRAQWNPAYPPEAGTLQRARP